MLLAVPIDSPRTPEVYVQLNELTEEGFRC